MTDSVGVSNEFPDGRHFAFTIIDDTDNGTVENLAPVYDLLRQLGFRTTKTVWPLRGMQEGGDSMEDAPYRDFVVELNKSGFEIALHGVQDGDARRERIKLGLDRFVEIIGHDPRIHCNHNHNRDNLYWGTRRLRSPLLRLIVNVATKGRYRDWFQGDREGSDYFWGDLCSQRIDYVRNLVFTEVNLDRINPSLPYRDPAKPWVKRWFSSCNGASAESFCRLLSSDNQRQLEAERGVCIVYTHFASGFVRDGSVITQFRDTMSQLASRNGWFVPAARLLDHLTSIRGGMEIPKSELRRMEWQWMREKARSGMV